MCMANTEEKNISLTDMSSQKHDWEMTDTDTYLSKSNTNNWEMVSCKHILH